MFKSTFTYRILPKVLRTPRHQVSVEWPSNENTQDLLCAPLDFKSVDAVVHPDIFTKTTKSRNFVRTLRSSTSFSVVFIELKSAGSCFKISNFNFEVSSYGVINRTPKCERYKYTLNLKFFSLKGICLTCKSSKETDLRLTFQTVFSPFIKIVRWT